MTKLKLATDLALPVDAVTEKLAFIGRTGQGKTYAAQKLAEEMHRAGAQFIALDPVGKWYSLRLAADGKAPGIPIPVLGGLNGDIPLEPTAGRLVADLVADRGTSIVLDVSQFESDAAKARFAQDFGERFFFRKKSAPSAVHIFLEEAQEFVPQNKEKGEEKMLHAFTRMWKLGRNFGIGGSLITQRPQEVNKKVLNLTELLICFQLTGLHERKAVAGWIQDKAIVGEDLEAELPKLRTGHPHAWSPAWLQISKVIAIADKWTFDASATPTVGGKAQERALAPIDLDVLRTKMAATIEKAKAEDPKELRRQLADKDRRIRELEARNLKPAVSEPTVERVEVQVVNSEELRRIEEIVGRALDTQVEAREAAVAQNQAVAGLTQVLDHARQLNARAAIAATPRPVQTSAIPARRAMSAPAPRPARQAVGDSEVGRGGLQRMLVALAQRVQGLSRRQLGVRACLSSRSGTFDTYLSRGRQAGWIVSGGQGMQITDAGLKALGAYDPLPTGQELLDHWLRELGESGAGRMLRALADVYPQGLDRNALGAAAGLSDRSGTFDTYLSRLRTLELVEGRGELRASEELFG